MTHCTTTFDPTNPAHRTVREWRGTDSLTWQHNARAYARVAGEAKVLRADGSVLRLWREDGKIRQRTYRTVIMVSS